VKEEIKYTESEDGYEVLGLKKRVGVKELFKRGKGMNLKYTLVSPSGYRGPVVLLAHMFTE
jgi:hypothetical protein